MWGSFFAVFGRFHFSALCPFLVAQKVLESGNQFLYQAYLSAGSPSVEVETTLIANFFFFGSHFSQKPRGNRTDENMLEFLF